MYRKYLSLPVRNVTIDAGLTEGPFEWWRHSIGHGGINSKPLPEKVVQGARALKPRLIRTFIQEYFYIYPDHGVFDWSRLDPYMDALHRTGADVVASITIKPAVLFPEKDQTIWRPNDAAEWQQVICELVRRYSVDKKIVTHWEIGNEPDIGEHGGCPYLIKNAADYLEYYRLTTEAVLKAFPAAKIGGPAIAVHSDPLFFEFIDLCRRTGTQLDFVSWHLYHDDPARHKQLVLETKERLDRFGPNRPEMLVTEWNKGFDQVAVEELAFHPRRAAAAAAGILAMMEAGLDWSFYYHVWDQTFYPEEFAPFYQDLSIMTVHWNEIPHRFGLFGVSGEVRPSYFVYRMLSEMDGERVQTHSEEANLPVAAVRSDHRLSAMLVNYALNDPLDVIASLSLQGLNPGPKQLLVYRIDENHSWDEDSLELKPVERREIAVPDDGRFRFQVYCPADSVTFFSIEG